MEQFIPENIIERKICNRADILQIPISGNFELLPLCNMDCKMCFAKMTKSEMEAHSPMRNYKEWLTIAAQAKEQGLMFLLLTGGEPFLYPDIEKLYFGLKKLGIIVSINTNGTLINTEIADWLAKEPPRRVNITLYGSSDSTYKRLCNNPRGFSQATRGIELLLERNIPVKINCSVTPYNLQDLDEIYQISKKYNIPIETAYYMMPGVRVNNINNKFHRLDAKTAAEVKLRTRKLQYSPEIFRDYVYGTLDKFYDYKVPEQYEKGFTCRAGNSVFWINYDGTMSACSFTQGKLLYNVFEMSFAEAWDMLKKEVQQIVLSPKCQKCHMRILCTTCAASAYSETGSYENNPEYHCELTSNFIKLLEMEKSQF